MFALSSAANTCLRLSRTRICLSLLTLATLSACSGNNSAPAAAGGMPPPPEVSVVKVARGIVGLTTELPGRAEAFRTAQVRARVAGILQRQLFREGSTVSANQPLFQIDPAPYQAALASAKASLAHAEANLMQAQAQAQRYEPLVQAKAVSQQDYVAAVAQQKLAQADVAAATAAVQTAQINLDYAHVSSPISGQIGRALVTEGALVGQGEVTPLALVQQINPMYVNVSQSAAELLALRAAIASGKLKSMDGKTAAQVRLILEDGSVYAQPGKLLFSDISVDPSSGQVALRVEVPNPKGVLLPGMYVRAQLQQAAADAAILLPQQAVLRSTQGDSVKVVAPDGSVSSRNVKISAGRDNQWVVLEGLQDGEMVVVEGFQKIPAKGTVKPVPWHAAADAATAAPAAAAPASAASKA